MKKLSYALALSLFLSSCDSLEVGMSSEEIYSQLTIIPGLIHRDDLDPRLGSPLPNPLRPSDSNELARFTQQDLVQFKEGFESLSSPAVIKQFSKNLFSIAEPNKTYFKEILRNKTALAPESAISIFQALRTLAAKIFIAYREAYLSNLALYFCQQEKYNGCEQYEKSSYSVRETLQELSLKESFSELLDAMEELYQQNKKVSERTSPKILAEFLSRLRQETLYQVTKSSLFPSSNRLLVASEKASYLKEMRSLYITGELDRNGAMQNSLWLLYQKDFLNGWIPHPEILKKRVSAHHAIRNALFQTAEEVEATSDRGVFYHLSKELTESHLCQLSKSFYKRVINDSDLYEEILPQKENADGTQETPIEKNTRLKKRIYTGNDLSDLLENLSSLASEKRAKYEDISEIIEALQSLWLTKWLDERMLQKNPVNFPTLTKEIKETIRLPKVSCERELLQKRQ